MKSLYVSPVAKCLVLDFEGMVAGSVDSRMDDGGRVGDGVPVDDDDDNFFSNRREGVWGWE